TSFGTDEDVGFEDFHGCRVRYTSAGLSVGIGYSASYLTFYGLGSGAASIPVGGWNKGLDASASLNEGVLHLYRVPKDYIIEPIDVDAWDTYTSEWVTEHSVSLYFNDGSADLTPGRVDLGNFALRVAQDVQTQ